MVGAQFSAGTLAEQVGVEPTHGYSPPISFQDCSLRPLGYCSMWQGWLESNQRYGGQNPGPFRLATSLYVEFPNRCLLFSIGILYDVNICRCSTELSNYGCILPFRLLLRSPTLSQYLHHESVRRDASSVEKSGDSSFHGYNSSCVRSIPGCRSCCFPCFRLCGSPLAGYLGLV